MKKLILLFIILTLSLSGCGIFDLDDWVVPDDAEFLVLVQELDTPRKISDYMIDNFTYEFHDTYALNPYELYKLGRGDCNEFVTFGTFIAHYHGYITYELGIFYKNFKHRIAVYDKSNYSITNNQYYYSGFNTFKEIVEFDSNLRNKVWSKYIVYDYWNNIVEQVTK